MGLKMKKILVFLVFLSILFSTEIDLKLLTDIAKQNPDDIKTRLILAKYYIKNENFQKANFYIKEILHLQPKNKNAKLLQKKIKRLKTIKKLLKEYGVNDLKNKKDIQKLFENLYKKKEYKKITIFYKLLSSQKISINSKSRLISALAFLKLNNIKKAKEIENKIKSKREKELLKGDICFFQKNYSCAERIYVKLLKASYEPEIMGNLLNTLYAKQDYKKFKILYNLIKERYAKDFNLKKLDSQLLSLQKNLLNTLKKEYEKKKDFISLKAYATSLYDFKKEFTAINTIKEYLKQNPNNLEAKKLLAKMLIWKQLYKEAIETLSPIKNKTQDILILYADALYYKGDYKKALKNFLKIENKTPEIYKKILFSAFWSQNKKTASKFLKKALKFYPNDRKIKIVKMYIEHKTGPLIKLYEKKLKKDPNNTQIILDLANLYKQEGNEKKALRYYKKYANLTNDPRVFKYLAQNLYFKGEYKKALPYFQKALKQKDYTLLYQYAITLQNLKEYEKAAKIYKELKRNPLKENILDIDYRYAFCLLKLNKEKEWYEAREIFKNILAKLQNRQNLSKKDRKLLKYAKEAYEISKRDFLKPKKYKDIVLAEGLNKQYNEYNSTKEAVNVLEALPVKLEKGKSINKILPKSFEKNYKKIKISSHYLKDSNDIKVKSLKIKVGQIKSKGVDFGLYGEKFSFENREKTKGFKTILEAKKEDIKLSLGINKFSDYSDPYASLEYETIIYEHLLKIMLKRENAIFYENEPYMEKNRISSFNILIRDYIKMLKGKEFTGEIFINRYKDKNIRVNPSFSYLFFKKRNKNIINSLLLSGWYQFYKKENPNYAYQKRDDSTRIEIQSLIEISKNLSITPKGSIGYSFFNNSLLYSLGILLDYKVNNYTVFSLECADNKSKNKNTSSDYNYKECYGDFYYRW